MGATIGPDGSWYVGGKKLSHKDADALVEKSGVAADNAHQQWGTGGIIDRNRNFTGNLLKNLAPAAAFIPGVGPLAAAAIGAGAGALGRGVQHGTNFGDIAKQGAQSGAAAYGLDKVAGAASAGAKAGGILGGAKSAAGALPGALKPVPVGGGLEGILGAIPGLGGALGGVGDFLTGNNGLNALGIAQGLNAAQLGQKSGNYAELAGANADRRWSSQAPLREKGIAGMLKPQPIDLSGLEAQRRQGNPFAVPQPIGR